MTFARRLIAGMIVVLLVTVLVLVIAADRWLRSDLERDVQASLERSGSLLGEALPADSTEWQRFAERFGAAGRVRVSIIDRAGRVRADTDVSSAELAGVESHAARPEVIAALAGGAGVATRRSTTTNTALMYVAVPGGPGVIRVAMPLDQVDAVVGRSQRSVLVAALVSLLLGIPLAWWAGRSITRPLTETAEAARTIAAGGSPLFPRSGIPDMDAMVTALRAMHEELENRFDSLRRKQAESSALVNTMVEGVISCDRGGRVLTANPAARRLLGYGAEIPLPELQVLFHQKAAREAVDATLKGKTLPDREILLDERTCLLSARPLPEGGAVLVLHDLTEMRRLETMRRDFVANVSHELKTPLTSISGYAETLLSDDLEEMTRKRFIETIRINALRMQRLVDDQLDLSRIESGGWFPEPVVVETETAIRAAWATGTQSSHAFDVAVAPAARQIVVDPESFHQILTNLFENARRYTPPGGRISASAAVEGGGIRVAVEDTGSGIGGEHLPRIFERFYRADPGRSRAEGGTGLGLAIVKHLVEAHGGRVSAESMLTVGSRISAWFPGDAGQGTST